MDRSLTICSVSFNSAPYLELNRRLTASLNPGESWTWLVVENSPADSTARLSSGDGFVVMDGIPQTFVGPASGSYHHGTALNRTLPEIRTRFALFLDPDFYIVRPAWMREVVSHMVENDLAFFGAPWHPRWVQKYRYFPCVQCMFVDLYKVDVRELDFTPDCPHLLGEHHLTQGQDSGDDGRGSLARRASSVLGRVLRNMKLMSFNGIGGTHDTGFHVYDRHHVKKQSRSECVTPVFNLKDDYIGPYLPASALGRLVTRALPDHVSYIPTHPGYYTREGFAGQGFPDMAGRGWEEFIWRGKPFGFHLRGHVRLERNEREKETLDQIIRVFEKAAAAPV